jgi:hypothetical protein
MPRRDGTGPNGNGAKTGRGLGSCSDENGVSEQRNFRKVSPGENVIECKNDIEINHIIKYTFAGPENYGVELDNGVKIEIEYDNTNKYTKTIGDSVYIISNIQEVPED